MLGDAAFGGKMAGVGVHARVEVELQDLFAARAEQREQAVRGNLRQRLGMVEIVAVLRAFVLLAFGDLGADHADLGHPLAQFADQRGVLAPAFHQDGACTVERGLGIGHALLGIDVRGGSGFRYLGGIGQQAVGQRFEAGFARDLGARAALGLVRQVEVFQARLAVGGFDLGTQCVGQLALLLDAGEHRGAAVLQFAQVGQARFEVAQLGVVQAAGDFLAVAGDEGDGSAFVEQGDGGLGLRGLGADLGGDGGGDVLGDLGIAVLHCVRTGKPDTPGGTRIVATDGRAGNGLTCVSDVG